MRGKAISEFRSPNALPRAPTPLGTEGVLRCCMYCVVDFCLYASVLDVERCADLVSVFFGTYGGTLCRSAICSLYSSIFMMVRCADLALYSSIFMVIRWADPVSVFFDTYRNILYQSDISGQDAQSASIPRMFFPVGWKRQPEEGGIAQQHPPLKTSKTSPTASTPGAMPPSSSVPLYIRLTSPQALPEPAP